MKKLFTILAVVVLTTTISSAQKRTVAIGVGSNLANVEWQNYKLVPVVGYFITDKIMLGTGLRFSTSTNDIDTLTAPMLSGDMDHSAMEIKPFVRFYVAPYFFLQAGVAVGSYTESYAEAFTGPASNSTDHKWSTFGVDAKIGYSLFWNDRICIEPSINISTGSGSGTGETVSSVGSVSTVTEYDYDMANTFDVVLGVGINIRLGSKE